MKPKFKLPASLVIFMIISALLFSGCANSCEQIDYYTGVMSEPITYNFFGGILHGILMPFNFIGSLFSSCIEMYASNHVKGWYDFGYLIGVIFSIGGGMRFSTSAKREFHS